MRNADHFQDDGGTPNWRARHATVVDARSPGFRAWFRRTSVWKLLWYAFLGAFVLPWFVLIFGLFLAYIVSR